MALALVALAAWLAGIGVPVSADPVSIPNSGFEEGAAGWEIPQDEGMSSIAVAPEAPGGHALRVLDTKRDAGSSISSALIPVTKPGFYAIHGRHYPVSGTGLGVHVHLLDAEQKRLDRGSHSLLHLGGAERRWLPFQAGFVVRGEAAFLQVWIHSSNAAEVEAYVDDLRIEVKEPTMDQVKDTETIKQRLHARAMAAVARISGVPQLVASMLEDGRWPDLDYADQSSSGWDPADHISRLRKLAIAYSHPESGLYKQAAVREAFDRGFDHWVAEDYMCPNWWANGILVPITLCEALIVLEDELDPERMQAGLRILERGKLGMTGQNLVWVAQVTIARGCLLQDPLVVAEAFGRIAAEIRITTDEGIQADASFHQHGAQLYSGGYGRGFSVDCAIFARLARGTGFGFPRDKVDILSFYILDGQQWMVRGKSFDHNVRGREICRPGSASARSLVGVCRDMVSVAAGRRDEFEAFSARMEGDPLEPEVPLIGNRHFWRGDLMTHLRRGYYASVRLTSPRLAQSESHARENLHGELLADGVNYLYRRGDEYDLIFAVWDWRRLPGITAEMKAEPPGIKNGVCGTRAFAGGCSDGLHGVAAMDFERGELTARKAWFFFDDVYVCLGAAITSPQKTEIATSINQCRSRGETWCAEGAGPATKVSDGRTLTGPAWFHHDDVGYAVRGPAAIRVANEAQHGSWYDISHSRSKERVELDVFSLGISHGVAPRGGRYEYIVAPGMPVDQAPALLASPPVAVLANTSLVQAVSHEKDGVTEIVFWQAGDVRVPAVGTVAVDQPILLLVRRIDAGLRVAAANPENEPLALGVRLEGKYEGDGCTWDAEANNTAVRFDLPDGPEAGQSVVRDLVRR